MEDVIERAKAGDRDALGQIWRAYHHLLLRYFRGKGMAEPEDLASTVWVEVASSLHRFNGTETDFRSWLFTIASRRRIDDIRSYKRRNDRTTQLVDGAPGPATAPDTADIAAQRDALDRAIARVRTLQPEMAEAVLLRVVADLSVTEVAAIMGKREGTVRVLVHRGIKRLAERPRVTNSPPESMYST